MLTQERLKELFHYDAETGVFTRLIAINGNAKAGPILGGASKYYLYIGIDNSKHLAHRLAWLYVHGEWPKDQLDHIDGVRRNNSIKNLRNVTNSVNAQNRKCAGSISTTGFLGVSKHRDKFRATIMLNGEYRHIGNYETAESASEAYLKAKRELHLGCTI